MAATAPGKTQSTEKRTLSNRILFSLLFFVIFLAAAMLIVLFFGRCSGDEFAASDFSRRTFRYFRIPVIKVQVTPVFRERTSNALVDHLRRKKYFPVIRPSWKIVHFNAGVDPPFEADESILCHYLDQRDSSYQLWWLRWSQSNPELACAFWPVIARVANENLYVLVPDLFQRARFSSNAADLHTELRSLIIRNGSTIAAGEQALGHHQRAAQVAAFVIATADVGNDADRQDAIDSQQVESDAIRAAFRVENEAIVSGANRVHSDPLPRFDPDAIPPSTDDQPVEEMKKGDDSTDKEPVDEDSTDEESIEPAPTEPSTGDGVI